MPASRAGEGCWPQAAATVARKVGFSHQGHRLSQAARHPDYIRNLLAFKSHWLIVILKSSRGLRKPRPRSILHNGCVRWRQPAVPRGEGMTQAWCVPRAGHHSALSRKDVLTASPRGDLDTSRTCNKPSPKDKYHGCQVPEVPGDGGQSGARSLGRGRGASVQQGRCFSVGSSGLGGVTGAP